VPSDGRLARRGCAGSEHIGYPYAEAQDFLLARHLQRPLAAMASSSSTPSISSTSKLPSEPEAWRPSTSPKLKPGALLDIDQGPLYDILTEWLHMKDVCGLDSALCNKKRRPEFLALVATKVLLFNREKIDVLDHFDRAYDDQPSEHSHLSAPQLSWILKRGIHLASLHLPPFPDTFPFPPNLKAEQTRIRDAVTSLALNGRLDKLKTITLNWCKCISDADLAAILSKCYRSVKSIAVAHCSNNNSDAHIKPFLSMETSRPLMERWV
jgi:hypothetical protein